MANQKLSAISTVSSANAADLIYIVQSGVSKGITVGDLLNSVVFLPFTVYVDSGAMSANPVYPYFVTVDRAMDFVQWGQSWYVNTTNNGSNYWNIILEKFDATLINSINTSAGSAGTWTQTIDTSFSTASVSTADKGIQIRCTKSGSPGTLYLAGPLVSVSI